MKYKIAGLEHQTDKGFGINAEAFKKSADFLFESEKFMNEFIPQKHMPIFFLYRHSIELFFKSMIVIFHSELSIPYPNKKPQILTENGKWRDLDDTHWVDALYWYWSKILIENKDKLERQAPKGNWVLPDLEEKIKIIANYDKDSTFFRYPFSKRNPKLDQAKYSMKKVNSFDDLKKVNVTQGGFTLILIDDNDNISSIYTHDKNTLSDELDIFRKTADMLYHYHLMTRMELCGYF